MRDQRSLLSVLLVIAVLGFSILACTVGGEPSVDEAVVARSLDDEYKPVEETTEFYPDETFHCSAKVSNLEKEAKVKANWFYGEELVGEYTYTTEEGGSGYVGFYLTPEETWPIGDYKVEVYLEEEAKTVSFSVVPPEGATPSQVKRAVTCKAVDEEYRPVEPSTIFAPTDVVHCSVNADLGLYSRLVAKWYFEGELLEDFVTTVIIQENISDTYTDFYLEPQLTEGDYTVEIYLDGELAKSIDFTVERPRVTFGPVTFAAGVSDTGEPVDVATQFPAGTTIVYAFASYEGMSDGAKCESVWYLDGEEAMRTPFDWALGESGTAWIANIHREDGVKPGRYDWELYVEGQLLQTGNFVVEEEAKPTPGADWKPYTSEALGFSIQHPPNWSVTEAEDQVRFEAMPDIGLFVAVFPGVDVSAQDLTQGVVDGLREDYPDLETTYTGSFSTEAAEWWEVDVIYTEEGTKVSLVLLCAVEEGTAYLIGAIAPEEEFDQWVDDFVAMVDSFRFLP